MPTFAAQDLIHQESPYCAAVDPALFDKICAYCLYWKKCEPCKCDLAFYCSASCKEKDAPDHEIECQWGQIGGNFSLLDNEVRLTIRALSRNHREQSSGAVTEGVFYEFRRSILDLKTHLEDLSEDEIDELNKKAQDIRELVDPYIRTELRDAVMMLQRLRINMFQLSDHRAVAKGLGCYLGISVVDHTCEDHGNFVLAFRGRNLAVTALKDFSVPDMKQFRINYLDPTFPYKRRRKILLQCYYFDCQCSKCQREASDLAGDSSKLTRDDAETLRQLEALYLTRCSNRGWLRKGRKLLKRLDRSTQDLESYRRDLYAQMQQAAFALGLYDISIRYAIMALKDVKLIHRGEGSLVSLCLAMKALGMDDPVHRAHPHFDLISRVTGKLLRYTYGGDYPAIKEIRGSKVGRAKYQKEAELKDVRPRN